MVDDAIVMLENIVRHLDMGKTPLQAALDGSAEVGFTIVSMTVSLVAVFIPVLFLEGMVGRLLREFAVTISRRHHRLRARVGHADADAVRLFLRGGHGPAGRQAGVAVPAHRARLRPDARRSTPAPCGWTLRLRLLMLLFSFAFIAGTAYYLVVLPKGFLPSEDTGQIYVHHRGAGGRLVRGDAGRPGRGSRRSSGRTRTWRRSAASVGAGGLDASPSNAGRMFIRLKPRDERTLSADEVVAQLRRKTAAVPGIKVYFQNPPPIRIGGRAAKSLYQLTVQGPDTAELYAAVPKLEARLRTMPDLIEVTSDLLIRSPQLNVRIDRDKATSLGVTARQIEDALANAYGSRQVTTIYAPNNEYQVVLEVKPEYQRDPDAAVAAATSGRRPGRWCRSTRSSRSTAASAR